MEHQGKKDKVVVGSPKEKGFKLWRVDGKGRRSSVLGDLLSFFLLLICRGPLIYTVGARPIGKKVPDKGEKSDDRGRNNGRQTRRPIKGGINRGKRAKKGRCRRRRTPQSSFLLTPFEKRGRKRGRLQWGRLRRTADPPRAVPGIRVKVEGGRGAKFIVDFNGDSIGPEPSRRKGTLLVLFPILCVCAHLKNALMANLIRGDRCVCSFITFPSLLPFFFSGPTFC